MALNSQGELTPILVPSKQEVNKNLPLFLPLLITKIILVEQFDTFYTKFEVKFLKIENLSSTKILRFSLGTTMGVGLP
jgi:hypothetical protein